MARGTDADEGSVAPSEPTVKKQGELVAAGAAPTDKPR